MATISERLAILVSADAGQAIATIKQVGAETKSLKGPIGEASGLMNNFGAQLGGLAAVAGPVALAAGFAKLADSAVGAFTSLAAEVKSFREVAGGTAEDASKMIAAFSAVGISTDTAAQSIFQLEKRLGTGAAALASFGVTAVRDSQGNTDMSATLLSVVDAYNKLGDPVQKAGLLTAAFGKQGTALIPILAKGKQGIADLYAEAASHGLILSDADISRADQLKASMRDLKEAVQGVEVEAGRGLIPVVTDAVSLIEKALERAHELASGPSPGAGGGWWDTLTGDIHTAYGALVGLEEKFGYIPDLFSATAAGIGDTGESAAQTTQDVNDLSNALQTTVDADRALASGQQTLAGDQRDLSRDQDAYNKLLAQGAVDAKAVADAQTAAAEAGRNLGHAQREQTKAQAQYNQTLAEVQALHGYDPGGKLVDDANNLADANDAVANAQDRQKQTQADLAAAKAGDPDYQDKLAAAKQKVADDTQKIADAEANVAKESLASINAHNAEATALNGKADAAETLIADYRTLISLNPEVQAALQPALDLLASAGLGPALGPPSPTRLPPGFIGPPAPGEAATAPTVLPPGFVGPVAPGEVRSASSVTNITVNTTNETDPLHVGRQVLWQLKG